MEEFSTPGVVSQEFVSELRRIYSNAKIVEDNALKVIECFMGSVFPLSLSNVQSEIKIDLLFEQAVSSVFFSLTSLTFYERGNM